MLRAQNVSGNWYKVSYSGKTGWVHSVYCVDSVGDLNDDGYVNSLDAVMILKYSVGEAELTETQLRRGDIDSSGTVDAVDALTVLKISLGIVV